MALGSLYVKRSLSSREISGQLASSRLTGDDCAILRPLSQKTFLTVSESKDIDSRPPLAAACFFPLAVSSLNKVDKLALGVGVMRIGSLCRASAPLPCLRINNSNKGACEDNTVVGSCPASVVPSWVYKSEFKVKTEVMALFQKYALENIGFLTLTFADDVQCHKEATKRLNSLITGVLRERYSMCIRVSERQKSGRWHFHLVVVCKQDIRRGVDFEAIKQRRYKDGANSALRAEWAFWRSASKKYGFGRCELLPVRKTGAALASYVAKYISKGFAYRKHEDKGARLYSVIGGSRACSSRFSFYSAKSYLWRLKVAAWVSSWSASIALVAKSVNQGSIDALTYDDLPLLFGKRWAWRCREDIMAMMPFVPPVQFALFFAPRALAVSSMAACV